ncbi:MAG TPA: AbrB/MazE/SpoVT family DNA-binding domain-containing protein [Caulobacter sp.]|nr:AbrB/MazE/SpoVT family DNA-binding domain-containing protein [Caulobacter sp.]
MPGFEEEGLPWRADASGARAKLFTHGGSQAVRLPKAFRFEGTEVSVRREGDKVILEPVKPRYPRSPEEWTAFWARLDAMRGDDLIELPEDPPPLDRDFGW